MYPVADKFHQLATQDAPRTRCRIYFIGDSVDCTNDADVIANGVLLKRNPGDTDSNGRIAQEGLSVMDMFNTDVNTQVGLAVSTPVELNLLNPDGALNNFAFGRCKIFIDVFDPDANDWLSCPMGVFIIDIPVKRNLQKVTASGYDQMRKLDELADAWWNEIDWTGGVTISDLITSLASSVGVALDPHVSSHILNGSKSYTSAPFAANQITYKNIAAWIGGVTGTNAYFTKDGALDFKWFSVAQINGQNVVFNSDIPGNQVLNIETAEYVVTPVDMLNVLCADAELNATVGSGGNIFTISGNPFYAGGSSSDIVTLATPVYNRISAIGGYTPLNATVITDWSIEAGDIVYFIFRDNATPALIMQQTMTWRGGYVLANITSNGEANRPTRTEAQRSLYRNEVQTHEFEVTVNQLRSLIQDLNGNYTLINQTVNQIENTVSGQGNLIQSILDPTGQIWTAIKTNSSDLDSLEDTLNGEISERKSYIRVLPLEPAIVLGVDTGNEIKLKLVNNIIYFFNGDDDSTDLSLAYAYFNSEEAGADRFVATESVQIGRDTSVARWMFKELSNGDLVLDLV